MATTLPKLSVPTYTDYLISTGKEFKYRTFLVGEESKLLLLKEGAEESEMYNTIQELVEACTFGELDVTKLPTYDIEHIFVLLRKKSVGEVVDLVVNHGEDAECKHKQEVSLNLNDIVVENKPDESKSKILLDKNKGIGIKLRHPNYGDLANFGTMNNQFEFLMKIIVLCTEYIYQGDQVFHLKDFTDAEVNEFFAGCSSAQQLTEVGKFFENSPKLVYNLKWKCEKCKKEDEVRLEGLKNFLL